MAPIWSTQPLKAIYTILFLLKTPPHTIALYVCYLVRPAHPDWDAKKSIAKAMVEMFFHYSTETRSRHILYDAPEKADDRLVEINPPDPGLFSGALAPTAAVKPNSVRGVWLPSPLTSDEPDIDKKIVILHFPGGAFLLNKHLNADNLLWAQYRLAANEETRFPAAVQDALAYYRFVLKLGVKPKNIILSGDSAGGNVVLALIRHIESAKSPELLRPGGAMVFSPWVKVTSTAARDYEACPNNEADLLTGPLLQWGANMYLPQGAASAGTEAYTSPLHHPFRTSVPLYIHAGAAEAFCESIKVFAEEMEQVEGNRVMFYAAPKGPHDLLLTHPLFGMTEEYCAALDEACEFLKAGS